MRGVCVVSFDSGKSVDTASMPISAYADDTRYAGFWIRFAAYIVDSILANIMLFIPVTILLMVAAMAGFSPKDPIISLAINMFILIGIAVYYLAFMASGWQATPGKRILGLHVIKTDGRKIGWSLAFGRYLAYIPSSLFLGVGFFMIGWSDEKKGMHDMICRTRVVHGKPQPRNLSTVFE